VDDDYDVVPYDDGPIAETHPDRLYVAARAHGIAAARPEGARILELGCAHAVNLLPIAAALPEARVLGIDRSRTQIERARRDVLAAGITNLEVRCADVATLDLGDERFDYVIAHGLFSWVPDAVRDRVLALGRQVLADHGVMYISYNAMPAWGLRGGVRRALCDLVDADAPAPERVRQARSAIAWLAETAPGEGTAEHALLADELRSLADASDAYLLHDYLVSCARSYWVREVVELAAAHGLAWIGDVAATGLTPNELRATTSAIAARVADPIAREQVLDIALHRQFRATLVGREGVARARPSPIDLVAPMRVAAISSDPAEGDDSIVAMLRETWPRDVPFAELARSGDVTEIAARVVDAWADGRLELRPRSLGIAAAVPVRPRVSASARAEATHLRFVTTPFHRCAPLDTIHARLVTLLDGTRCAAELVDALHEDLRVGRLTADAPIERVVPMLGRFVESALARMVVTGLIVDDRG